MKKLCLIVLIARLIIPRFVLFVLAENVKPSNIKNPIQEAESELKG